MAPTEISAVPFKLDGRRLPIVPGDPEALLQEAWVGETVYGYDKKPLGTMLARGSEGQVFVPRDLRVVFPKDGGVELVPSRDLVKQLLTADGKLPISAEKVWKIIGNVLTQLNRDEVGAGGRLNKAQTRAVEALNELFSRKVRGGVWKLWKSSQNQGVRKFAAGAMAGGVIAGVVAGVGRHDVAEAHHQYKIRPDDERFKIKGPDRNPDGYDSNSRRNVNVGEGRDSGGRHGNLDRVKEVSLAQEELTIEGDEVLEAIVDGWRVGEEATQKLWDRFDRLKRQAKGGEEVDFEELTAVINDLLVLPDSNDVLDRMKEEGFDLRAYAQDLYSRLRMGGYQGELSVGALQVLFREAKLITPDKTVVELDNPDNVDVVWYLMNGNLKLLRHGRHGDEKYLAIVYKDLLNEIGELLPVSGSDFDRQGLGVYESFINGELDHGSPFERGFVLGYVAEELMDEPGFIGKIDLVYSMNRTGELEFAEGEFEEFIEGLKSNLYDGQTKSLVARELLRKFEGVDEQDLAKILNLALEGRKFDSDEDLLSYVAEVYPASFPINQEEVKRLARILNVDDDQVAEVLRKYANQQVKVLNELVSGDFRDRYGELSADEQGGELNKLLRALVWGVESGAIGEGDVRFNRENVERAWKAFIRRFPDGGLDSDSLRNLFGDSGEGSIGGEGNASTNEHDYFRFDNGLGDEIESEIEGDFKDEREWKEAVIEFERTYGILNYWNMPDGVMDSKDLELKKSELRLALRLYGSKYNLNPENVDKLRYNILELLAHSNDWGWLNEVGSDLVEKILLSNEDWSGGDIEVFMKEAGKSLSVTDFMANGMLPVVMSPDGNNVLVVAMEGKVDTLKTPTVQEVFRMMWDIKNSDIPNKSFLGGAMAVDLLKMVGGGVNRELHASDLKAFIEGGFGNVDEFLLGVSAELHRSGGDSDIRLEITRLLLCGVDKKEALSGEFATKVFRFAIENFDNDDDKLNVAVRLASPLVGYRINDNDVQLVTSLFKEVGIEVNVDEVRARLRAYAAQQQLKLRELMGGSVDFKPETALELIEAIRWGLDTGFIGKNGVVDPESIGKAFTEAIAVNDQNFTPEDLRLLSKLDAQLFRQSPRAYDPLNDVYQK